MRSLAVLSLHTSPLVQPGTGDSGGMNVYVRELVSSLAQAGVSSTVYVRRWAEDLPEVVDVEPGFRVVHVDAGPVDLPKDALPDTIPDFTDGVAAHLECADEVDAVHANYWLSGVAGHDLKHRYGLPLVSTFHTLSRVKAAAGDWEPRSRAEAEAAVIGCSDRILANGTGEANELVRLYGAPRERIEIVPPGVDHAFFSPGDRGGARAALGLGDEPTLLFVGRIQPLKGLRVAVGALARLRHAATRLVVVGGPSGRDGGAELALVQALIAEHDLTDRVTFVPPQPHHRLSTYYRAADLCVVPSRSESFGLVALEAAACGTPVVAAAVGGLTTLVEHGRTGALVDELEPGAFATRIDRLLGAPEALGAMGRAAARSAAAYTWPTAAARLRRIYTDLAARSLVRCA